MGMYIYMYTRIYIYIYIYVSISIHKAYKYKLDTRLINDTVYMRYINVLVILCIAYAYFPPCDAHSNV